LDRIFYSCKSDSAALWKQDEEAENIKPKEKASSDKGPR
jgi:hypothetical protein